jgi:ABC-type transport system involved in Fe-S cluster assembly fused permease/ATPase subunit
MRAEKPDVDLLVFDEPVSELLISYTPIRSIVQTSSLDPHAQNNVFATIEKISRSPTGQRIRTVIFITHRLSTARRADKIAMMQNGVGFLIIQWHVAPLSLLLKTITEIGSHQELISRGGEYAALYRASI